MLRVLSAKSNNLFCVACKSNSNNSNVFGRTNLFKFPAAAAVPLLSVPSPLLPVVLQSRDFQRGSQQNRWWQWDVLTPKDDVTFWGRTLRRLGFMDIPKSVLKRSGFLLYMKVADELDYLKFFQGLNMPDTFASWFAVLELHVWLLSARLMQDGKEGRLVRNHLIKAMWEDNDTKSKKLEGALSSARKKDLQGLNQQFYAAMMAYDEGLMGDDYILAGALWRRFLRLDGDPPLLQAQNFESRESHQELLSKVKALEMLVIYVRSQYYILNSLSREQLLRKRAVKFPPFDELDLFQLYNKMEKMSSSSREAAKLR